MCSFKGERYIYFWGERGGSGFIQGFFVRVTGWYCFLFLIFIFTFIFNNNNWSLLCLMYKHYTERIRPSSTDYLNFCLNYFFFFKWRMCVCVCGGNIQIYREGVIHFWLVRDIQIGGIRYRYHSLGFLNSFLVNNNDEETWYEQSEYSIS